MRPLKTTFFAMLTAAMLPLAAVAAPGTTPAPADATQAASRNPMSVHVLDMQTGTPSEGVQVVLERQQDGRWVRIANGVTDHDGRIGALYPATQALQKGDYRVTFETGAWFEQHNVKAFYPVVQLVLRVDGSVPHYHVPLLLSPFGYTTYRGS